MYQYFKRQLKTPTCFGSFGIHPQGVLNVLHWNYLRCFVCVVGVWQCEIWTCGVCACRLCALRSIQPLKLSTRDFSWGKGGRCFWLTTYHPRSAEMSKKSGALTYPEPLGPPRPVAGDLYLHVSLLLHHPQGILIIRLLKLQIINLF